MSCVTEKPLADDSVLAETLSVMRWDRGEFGAEQFWFERSPSRAFLPQAVPNAPDSRSLNATTTTMSPEAYSIPRIAIVPGLYTLLSGTQHTLPTALPPGVVVQIRSGNSANFLDRGASEFKVRRFLADLAREVWADVENDRCLDLAAQMSFYFVLSLFPFLLVIGAIVGWLPSTNLWRDLAQWITDYLPRESRRLVFATILDLTRGYTRVLSLGLLATVWTASSGFVSLMESLSVVYGVRETRGFWRKRAVALSATAIGAFFLVASFGLLASGHWAALAISVHLRTIFPFEIPWEVARWLATLLLMFLGLDLIHYFLPNGNRPWRWLTPGTLFVALTFVSASVGFNFYLRHFDGYPRFYGTLAGFIILMTWIYISSVILLIGAETDNAMRRLKEHGEAS
jgi:membrane protein